MKKVLIVFISFFFILCFVFTSMAATYTAYGSVLNSTSQVQQLVGLYLNSDVSHKWTNDFIVMRSGQYQYDLFYGDFNDRSSMSYYRLTNVQQGYSSEWVLSSGSVSNFDYQLNNFTAVGNVDGTIRSSEYSRQRFEVTGEIFLVILIILGFLKLLRFGGRKVEL